MFDSSTPREIKKATGDAPRNYSRVVATDLKVAIVPAAYPEVRLSEEQGQEVLKTLEGEFDDAPDGSYFPSFLDNWFQRGAPIFNCRDQKDKAWLMENAGRWTCGEGTQLKAIEVGDLQKLIRAMIYAPGAHTAEVIVKRLRRQNPTLDTNSWVVTETRKVTVGPEGNKKEETALRLLLKGTEVEALKTLDFRPFCGGGRAHVVSFKEKVGGERGAKESEQMEVDTDSRGDKGTEGGSDSHDA